MHRAISAALFSALLSLGATAALADSTREFKGEVSNVDRYSESIVVRGGEPRRRLKFFLSRSGQVTNGGRAVSLADLKRGEQVEVIYTKDGSTLRAHTIAVVGGGAPEAIGLRE